MENLKELGFITGFILQFILYIWPAKANNIFKGLRDSSIVAFLMTFFIVVVSFWVKDPLAFSAWIFIFLTFLVIAIIVSFQSLLLQKIGVLDLLLIISIFWVELNLDFFNPITWVFGLMTVLTLSLAFTPLLAKKGKELIYLFYLIFSLSILLMLAFNILGQPIWSWYQYILFGMLFLNLLIPFFNILGGIRLYSFLHTLRNYYDQSFPSTIHILFFTVFITVLILNKYVHWIDSELLIALAIVGSQFVRK